MPRQRTVFWISILLIVLGVFSGCPNQSAPSVSQPEIKHLCRAYLDIETTGLKHSTSEIIIIGVYLEKGDKTEFIHLVGDEITAGRLKTIFKNVDTLYTYNGISFDLAFIKHKLNLDLTQYCRHVDLMKVGHAYNLKGGLKEVEKKLGIGRESDITGKDVPKLWKQYKDNGDKQILDTLLKYNKEDVINLSALRVALDKLH